MITEIVTTIVTAILLGWVATHVASVLFYFFVVRPKIESGEIVVDEASLEPASNLAVRLEFIEHPAGAVFLAFDENTNKFLGQDTVDRVLYKSIFERFPKLKSLDVQFNKKKLVINKVDTAA